MKKKFLVAIVALFSVSFLVNASQTLWIHCIGDRYVPVCTVDADYFDRESDYQAYITDLMETMC